MKERADVLLAKQGLFNSRTQAQRAIMAGLVSDHNHQRIDKSGTSFPEDEHFYIKKSDKKYVSRGGFKLEKALESFEIDLTDKICLDIGASTGGFTDVALQNHAKMVYALDVGYISWLGSCEMTNALWSWKNKISVLVNLKILLRDYLILR